jgi:uncharacterized protein YodC (DUF2158 family)
MLSRHSPEQRVCSARIGGDWVALMAALACNARPGNPVRLKSGGVVMTAERVNLGGEPPFARCVWLDARQGLRSAFIALEALELAGVEEGV